MCQGMTRRESVSTCSEKQLFRYPGQEHVSGSSKIPTVLCYDSLGQMRAAGAEALLAESTEQVEDGEWTKVEWCVYQFKVLS